MAAVYLKVDVPMSAINRITTATRVPTIDTPLQYLIFLVIRTILGLPDAHDSSEIEAAPKAFVRHDQSPGRPLFL
jgi:hypothetical protein